jgi:hypothetical protein
MRISRLRQSRLASFVDRTEDVAAFKAFLHERDRIVFWVSGESGIGKTTLLTKIVIETLPPGLLVIELSGSTGRQLEPFDLMRTISSQINGIAFSRFRNAVTERKGNNIVVDVAPSTAIAVGSHASFLNSQVGSISGLHVETLNVNITPTPESIFAQNEINRITDLFLEDLSECDLRPTLISVDAAERLSTRCKAWICEELVPALIDRIDNIKVLVCSQEQPSFSPHLQPFITVRHLNPVTVDVIKDYLKIHRVREDLLEGASQVLFLSTRGNMLMIANIARGLLTLQQGALP